MFARMHDLTLWLADFYLAATVLLVVLATIQWLARQPAQRITAAWCGLFSLVALAIFCALPGWPRLVRIDSLLAARDTAPAAVAPLLNDVATSNGERAADPSSLTLRTRSNGLRPAIAAASHSELGDVAEAAPASESMAARPNEWPDVAELIAFGFLAGATCVAAWLVIGANRARRLCATASAAPATVQGELERLVGPTARAPRLLISSELDTAAAWGMLRPTILLPARAMDDTRASGLRAILSHEWAHIRLGDLWLLALGRMLLVALYAHPLYWWVRRTLRNDQELLADALAADTCGRHEYAASLVDWARHCRPPARHLRAAMSMSHRPGQLARRIAILLDPRVSLVVRSSATWRWTLEFASLGLVIAVSVLTVRPLPLANAAPPEDPEQEQVKREPESAVTMLRVTIGARCVLDDGAADGQRAQPAAGARVRLFRIDNGKTLLLRPSGRTKLVQGFLRDMKLEGGGALGSTTSFGDPDSQRLVAETQTDATGAFRFANLALDDAWLNQTSTIWICVQTAGRGTQWNRAIFGKDGQGTPVMNEIEFKLPPAARLSGQVKDSSDRPVAGALVYLPDLQCLARPIPGIACAVTDAAGRYEIADLPPLDVESLPPHVIDIGVLATASFVACVDHRDFAQQVIEFKKLPAAGDAVLLPPAKLHGRLLADKSGQPITQAYLRWEHDQGMSGGISCDAQGQYRIERLQPGKYKLYAAPNEFLPSTQTVELTAGENTVDLRLKQGGIIRGRLIDTTDGKPPSYFGDGMTINAHVEGADAAETAHGYPQPGGTFTMAVWPGKNQLLMFPSSIWQLVDAERWQKEGVDVAAGQKVEIELQLKPQRKLGLREWMGAKPLDEKALVASRGEWITWPDVLLPKQIISEQALLALLDNDDMVQIERDETDQVTSLAIFPFAIGEDVSDHKALWLGRQVLAHLKSFPRLRSLILSPFSGGDAALEPLRGHAKLEQLAILHGANFTAAGFELLATLPNLKVVTFIGSSLDDESIRLAVGLPQLRSLTLGGTFSDAGLAHLAGKQNLVNLSILAMGKSRLTDAGLKHLAGLVHLEGLALSDADNERFEVDDDVEQHWHLTDAGLIELAGLTELGSLGLRSAAITDAGLAHLAELKNLRHLDLENCSVTSAGIDQLKAKLIHLKVIADPVDDK